MIPTANREQLLDALDLFDQELRDTGAWQDWERKYNHSFAVRRADILYPVKQIVHLATGVPVAQITEGSYLNDYIRQHGLEVVPIARDGSHASIGAIGPARRSELAARAVFERALPDPMQRKLCLDLLAMSIKEAHNIAPHKWSVTLYADRVWLTVGVTVVCIIHRPPVTLSLDGACLSDAAIDLLGEERLNSDWYRTPAHAAGISLQPGEFREVVPLIWNAHVRLLSAAAEEVKSLTANTREAHSPGVLAYLTTELGRVMPEPEPESVEATGESVWWVTKGGYDNGHGVSGLLWAPNSPAGKGRDFELWERMGRVRKGDVIVCLTHRGISSLCRALSDPCDLVRPPSRGGVEEAGRQVEIEYFDLTRPVSLDAVAAQIAQLEIESGPIDSAGEPRFGLLFPFSPAGLALIRTASPEPWPEWALACLPEPETAMIEPVVFALPEPSEGGAGPDGLDAGSERAQPALSPEPDLPRHDDRPFRRPAPAFAGRTAETFPAPPAPVVFSTRPAAEPVVDSKPNPVRAGDFAPVGAASPIAAALSETLRTREQPATSATREAPLSLSDLRSAISSESGGYAAKPQPAPSPKSDEHLPANGSLTVTEPEADGGDEALDHVPLFEAFLGHLRNAGLFHDEDLLAAYLLALQTKRFVILEGPSGVGKTHLALTTARFLRDFDRRDQVSGDVSRSRVSARANRRSAPEAKHVEGVRVIPVRPEWKDSSGLIGRPDTAGERARPTPFVNILLAASQEADAARREGRAPAPYFVILDDMCLAPPERYLAEYLSCLESGEPLYLDGSLPAGQISAQPADAPGIPASDRITHIEIPSNFFVIGTVHSMDAAALHPKVLDRAFTIEMDGGSLADYAESFRHGPDTSHSTLYLGALPEPFVCRYRPVPTDWKAFARLGKGELQSMVIAFHDALVAGHHLLGYRSANEIARFVLIAAEQAGKSPDTLWTALDWAITQKLSAKLAAHSRDTELLTRLFSLAVLGKAGTGASPSRWTLVGGSLIPLVVPGASWTPPRLPHTARRIWRLLNEKG